MIGETESQATTKANQDNPLVQGIQVIGIGKHGSKPLTPQLTAEIARYLAEEEPIPIQKGAFFGALLAKGATPDEQRLLLQRNDGTLLEVEDLYDWLCSDAPPSMRNIGLRLMQKEHLTVSEAVQLGEFLFSNAPGEAFRGMAASMLRIRYETDQEYQGLMEAIQNTFSPSFSENRPETPPLVQIAEPFDGVEHSYLITPLLAQLFQQAGYPALVAVGRSAGPKLTLNALDLYEALGGQFLSGNAALAGPVPEYGWALDQKILSPALDHWVDRRLLIKKRPFLSTLEKVLNPCKARILVTSVFHITYLEKMVTLADMAGFDGVLVLKRGLEGTLAPSIAKASGLTCAARQPDGSFLKQSFEASLEEFAPFRGETDEIVSDLRLAENVRLIRQYSSQGNTDNQDFDIRVQLAFRLYAKGLQWLEENLAPSSPQQ